MTLTSVVKLVKTDHLPAGVYTLYLLTYLGGFVLALVGGGEESFVARTLVNLGLIQVDVNHNYTTEMLGKYWNITIKEISSLNEIYWKCRLN